jgi:hypothetical protein
MEDAALSQVATDDIDLEVRRALDREVAESTYLARQMSVFGDR